MRKRNIITASLVTGVLGISTFLFGFSNGAEGITVSASTTLNNEAFSNSAAQDAATTAFGASLSDIENATLNLKMTPKDNYTITTLTGALSVGKNSFPVTFDPAIFASMNVSKGTMWFGPVNGSLTLPSGKTIGVILGTEFIPQAAEYETSLTLEDLGTPVHLFFGSEFVEKTWGANMRRAYQKLDFGKIHTEITQLGLQK